MIGILADSSLVWTALQNTKKKSSKKATDGGGIGVMANDTDMAIAREGAVTQDGLILKIFIPAFAPVSGLWMILHI